MISYQKITKSFFTDCRSCSSWNWIGRNLSEFSFLLADRSAFSRFTSHRSGSHRCFRGHFCRASDYLAYTSFPFLPLGTTAFPFKNKNNWCLGDDSLCSASAPGYRYFRIFSCRTAYNTHSTFRPYPGMVFSVSNHQRSTSPSHLSFISDLDFNLDVQSAENFL